MSDPLRDAEAASAAAPTPSADFWLKEIDLALKREKKWRDSAERVVKLYEGGKKQDNSFNILYSNTETLLPACYNQLPRPIVERRFKDTQDPLAKASATVLERTLSYLMDSPDGEYDPFGSLMEQAVLGGLVPGRGVTRFRYDPKFEDVPEPLGDEKEGDGPGDTGAEEEEGAGEELYPDVKGKRVIYETVCGQDVDYDCFLTGFARRWVDMPWIAYYHAMTKEDLEKNFGSVVADQIKLLPPDRREPDGTRRESEPEGEYNRGSVPVAEVWEIWYKAEKCVIFFCKAYGPKIIKKVEDPLGLSGFYDCPEPLQFLLKRSSTTPTPLYTLYEEQAEELNRISLRLNRVLNAMKVRGFYDGTIQGLADLLTKDDNTLIAAKNVAALPEGWTLDKSIWMMPLEKMIQVVQELIVGRQECKQTIYEITGIADIMRGQGQASETATAQQIKNQWGSLRVKRLQRYVQTYVRGCLRIMGELAGEHFSPETFKGMTNLDYAMPQDIEQAKQQMQVIQQQAMQMPQQPPQPGQPPSPPQLPPQMQQAMQQAQAILAKPQWEQVIGLLRQDLTRHYRIDIETDSTIDATTQQDKQDITDAMQALAQTAQSFEPLVMQQVMPLAAFKQMMVAVARRFKFGRAVEESFEAIPDQVPPQQDPKGEAQAAMQQVQQEQSKLQQDKQAFELAQQKAAGQQEIAAERQQNLAEKAQLQMEMFEERLVAKIESILRQHEQGVQQLVDSAKPQPVPDTAPKVGQQVAAEVKQRQAQKQTDQTNQMRHQELVTAVTQSNNQLAAAIADLVKQSRGPAALPPNGGGV